MKRDCHLRVVYALLFLALCVPHSASSQSTPNVPAQYKRLFFLYSDQRSLYEKALNSIKLTSLPVGRSFALIAGVTQYPNFPETDQSLRPAAVDIEKLKSYLRDQEFFDEIVVLKDGDMNLDNLNYFLQSYFPERLRNSPHSRFLFAYSGHGYADGKDDVARGFLLTSPASSGTDPLNRIDLSLLRALLDPDIDSAEKVLVLINSCQSGAFLGRKPFGPPPSLGPGDRGAHAIMASRTSQQSLQLASVGPGSVFFEKVFAALGGAADNSPRDGVVTYHELDSYLRSEIPYVTNNNQIPMEGDISRNGSVGEFFFLNRGRQVQAGNLMSWNPGNAKTFGTEGSDFLERGRSAFRSKRYDEARLWYEKAAAVGNDQAMNSLGVLYHNAIGVPREYQQARQWYEKAAAAGNARAMDNLGTLYGHGLGVALDYQQARQWHEKAALADDAKAMSNLGYLYQHGLGVPRDYQQAQEWFEKGAAAGSADAMVNLGVKYANGEGVAQDYQQALRWFERAAAGGDAVAMSNLGYLYDTGHGVTQDYQQARQWYEKAATGGNTGAMFNLGNLYEFGHGVARDYERARQWFEKAAAGGNAQATDNLGWLYEHGQGVTQDYQQARQWYEKGAAAGNSSAMYHLGRLYEFGFGVARDLQRARQWYEKAAENGHLTAKARLKTLP